MTAVPRFAAACAILAAAGGGLRSHDAATGLAGRPRSGGARDLERQPELPVHERDRGRAVGGHRRRSSPRATDLAGKLASETTPLDDNERWWVWKCPTKGCPGLLHAAGYALEKHAVYVVCDGTCGKTFLR